MAIIPTLGFGPEGSPALVTLLGFGPLASFDTTTITEGPLFFRDGANLLVTWSSSSPEGTWFQVYVDQKLVWAGTQRHVVLPSPRGRAVVAVGTIPDGQEQDDFSADLPDPPGTGNRARLTWRGGAYLGATILGYRIYMSPSAGASVNTTTPAGFVAAYTPNVPTGGFGDGGFGDGGFGDGGASGTYSWISPVLGAGVWSFQVKSVDAAGNEGTAATSSRTIATPPRQPAAPTSGPRLAYTYSAITNKATLTWLASPADPAPLTPP